MLIVSQNKKLVVPLENVEGLHIEEKYDSRKEGFSIVHEGLRMTSVLGTYITEERAKEVLQEITKAYVVTELLKSPQFHFDRAVNGTAFQGSLDYQMPEE